MVIISITMIAIFLLGMFAFGCAKLLCILGIFVSVLVLLLKLKVLPTGKLSVKVLKIISTSAIAVMFILGAFTSMSSVEGGINDYEDKLDSVMALLEEDELYDAREEIDSIKELYGASDNIITLEALLFIGEEEYDNAENIVYGYSSRTSVEYYTLMEMVYLSKGAKESADKGQVIYLK